MTTSRQLGKLILNILGITSAGILFTSNIASINSTTGPSMLPTISLRSYILVSRLKPKLKRGDVITFTSPIEPQKGLVKRIIGLEGDVILNDGNKYEIPMGHLWVVGDNLNFSIDSRDFGPVSVGLVHGKVVFDFNRFRFIV